MIIITFFFINELMNTYLTIFNYMCTLILATTQKRYHIKNQMNYRDHGSHNIHAKTKIQNA